MPTKERRLREEAKKRELAELAASLPTRTRKAPLANAFGAALDTDPVLNLRGGLLCVSPDGEVAINTRAMRIKFSNNANDDRLKLRGQIARTLKVKYSLIWNKRGAAKKIAIESGLAVTTIRGYMRDFP